MNWLIMNRDQWNALPTEFQEIIREQAALAQERNLRLGITDWLEQEIQQNIDQGMEYTKLAPALRNAFRGGGRTQRVAELGQTGRRA